ncbi:MAG: hypothetical protein ACRENF_00125 [Thermodesulfobacteriota bacterium]
MNQNGANSITDLEKRVTDTKKRYSKYLEERERKRKREHDVHFTKKDQEVLIKSFVIAGVLEHGLRRILTIL